MNREELDALIALSRTHRDLHQARISREFRIVITTFTFYVLCVAAKYSSGVELPTGALFIAVVWATFLLVFAFAYWDIYTSGRANNINQEIAHEAENQIIRYLQDQERFDQNVPHPQSSAAWRLLRRISPGGQPRRYAWLWQILIILMSAVAAAYVITCL